MDKNEKSDTEKVVFVAALVVIAVFVVPVVVSFGTYLISAIAQAFQPKQYKMTLTFMDGHMETRQGTKEELEAWVKSKGMHVN